MNPSKDQKQAIEVFSSFIADPEAFDMFITGQAGTGKTTVLNEIVQKLIKDKVPYVVCAYTHKAKEVLRSKLPEGADVRTLHSFLRKRPGVNENAKNIKQIQTTTQFGSPEPVKLLIVDEFSMVGEKDVMSIGELQDPDYEGMPIMKVLYVGDLRQLPPVGQQQILQPEKCQYHAHLIEVHRQGAGPLLDTICDIVDMIDGKTKPHYLKPHKQFHRDVDIVKTFAANKDKVDSVVLAWTNRRVQELNEMIFEECGFSMLYINTRWSPTLREDMVFLYDINPGEIDEIRTYSGELCFGTKYSTLEYLIKIAADYNIKFGQFSGDEGEFTLAYIFGHGDYNDLIKDLQDRAAGANNLVPSPTPVEYCKQNPHSKVCRKRAKAWRDFLTIKDSVMCIDYPFAQTVHKSQGSTFKYVYVDNEDLSRVMKQSMKTYLQLLYVAMSRASDSVYFNN